jgi:hypothetical protein
MFNEHFFRWKNTVFRGKVVLGKNHCGEKLCREKFDFGEKSTNSTLGGKMDEREFFWGKVVLGKNPCGEK